MLSVGLDRCLLAGVLALILSEVGCSVTSPRTPAARNDDGIERMAFRARQFRGHTPVLPSPDGSIVAEAEEFQPVASGAWRPGDWGENYYAATMSNTFLSRKAFLGAPEQCDRSEAAITVRVPRAGKYLALVRYEAVYRFETQFGLRIEQNGQERLQRLYGDRWGISALAATTGTPLEYRLEFGVRNAAGVIESIGTFEARAGQLLLAYDANTRYSRRIRRYDVVLYDLLDYLKAHRVPGAPPKRTIVYAFAFEPSLGDDRYAAAVAEFVKLMGITVTGRAGNPALTVPSGYVDVRGELGAGLDRALEGLKSGGLGDKIRTVSVGDEIDLKTPPAADHEGFRAWARAQGLEPSDVVAGAGPDWSKVRYDSDPGLAKSDPRAYYYARLYAHAYGIADLKAQTDKIKRALPHADAGANFMPANSYLGTAHKYISTFRRGGLTMPWGEDYAWQIPLGTQQVSFLQMDLFRAGTRYLPKQGMHFYVMPHWPGNTVKSWRRMWYGALGHGMKIANLFELRPVQAASSENHVSLPAMYREIRRSIYELASFKDIVQDGRIRGGNAALWYSETGDAWEDHADPYGSAKRLLYAAITHQQPALDVVDEEDALRGTLGGYRVLYLALPCRRARLRRRLPRHRRLGAAGRPPVRLGQGRHVRSVRPAQRDPAGASGHRAARLRHAREFPGRARQAEPALRQGVRHRDLEEPRRPRGHSGRRCAQPVQRQGEPGHRHVRRRLPGGQRS